MRIVSRVSKAAKAADSWYNTYYDKRFGWSYGEDKAVTYDQLVALGREPDPDDVDRIIGNNSWTSTRCDECGTSPQVVVMVGEEPAYESNTVFICSPCILKLREMI